MTPLVGKADGLIKTHMEDDGDGGCRLKLNRSSKTEWSQIVTLNGSGGYTLTFDYYASLDNDDIDYGGHTSYFEVYVIDESNQRRELLSYSTTNSETHSGSQDIDLSEFSGQQITLLFKYSSDSTYSWIDNISIKDSENREFLTNGDFNSCTLDGWTVPDLMTSQNIMFAPRTLGDVNVTRSFFTKPNSLWGRWVDTYENITDTAVDINITYYTNLGSDGAGIIYYTPDTNNQALTTWDGDNSDRDIGMVFGNANRVEFTSDTGIGNYDGSDYIDVTYENITIPAHAKVSVVNFIVMNGKDTADTAEDITARAVEIDEENQAIVDGMNSGVAEYFEGMTEEQYNTIYNF
jgi:hypothetical protein